MGANTGTKATGRIINYHTCEVWCPLDESDVCVFEKCLAGKSVNLRDRCRFLERIQSPIVTLDVEEEEEEEILLMPGVLCTWPEPAPREDDS